MGQFASDIRRFRANVKVLKARKHKEVFIELCARIVQRTPIDTGEARGHWTVTRGSPAGTTTDQKFTAGGPTSGSPTFPTYDFVGAQMEGLQPYGVVWFSNAAPHIDILEFGGFPNPPKNGTGKTVGGYSTQAPNGMVRITVVEFEGIVREVRDGQRR